MTQIKNDINPLPDRNDTQKLYSQLRSSYEAILHDIYSELRALATQHKLVVTIKYRLKGFDSYCDKIRKLNKLQGGERLQITDLLGIRIVCPFLEDIEAVEQLLAHKYEILELEHKAEQHSFREFGYDSVHVLIRTPPLSCAEMLPCSSNVCEIQLRTILQEAWAEVEHELVYKSDIGMPNQTIRRKLASLNASLTLSDLIFQEIRESQREIRRRGIKCRHDIETLSLDYGDLESLQVADFDNQTEDSDESPLASRKLEKLMVTALEAHSNEQFQRAIDLYSLILRQKLDNTISSLIYNHRGMAWFALAEYQQGTADFDKSIEFNSDNVRAWCNRGLAYRILEKLDASISDYNQAVEIGPRQYDGYWGRAQTCYEMKLFSRALSDCRKTIELRGDFTPALELEKTIQRQLF